MAPLSAPDALFLDGLTADTSYCEFPSLIPTAPQVLHAIETAAFKVVYQPIVDIRMVGNTPRIAGYEALSRFADGSPTAWFAAASRAGLRVRLELAAIRAAIAGFSDAPDQVYLALNSSVETLCSPLLFEFLEGISPDRVVLELPEDTLSENYDRTKDQIGGLLAQGYRLALDDLARDRVDLSYLIRVRPSIIKIDMSMTRNLDHDPSKRSVIHGLRQLADVLRADVIAEGIERTGELLQLQKLGVQFGQGYLLGRPGGLLTPDPGPKPANHPARPRRRLALTNR